MLNQNSEIFIGRTRNFDFIRPIFINMNAIEQTVKY